MNIVVPKIEIRSKSLKEGDSKIVEDKVMKWQADGYSTMAILHFLGQDYQVSGTYEGDIFVITVN